jgi:putative ABC transport system permease protein
MNPLKPLSELNYIRNNIRKLFPQIITVMLGVFLVYFVCIIGGGIKFPLDDINKPYEKLSIIHLPNEKSSSEKIYNELNSNKDVEKVIYGNAGYRTQVKMIIESCGSPVFFTDTEDMKYLMNKYNFKLKEGKIPSASNEILVNDNYAKSYNVKLGDDFGSEVSESQYLDGKYKIVGIYQGDFIMLFGYKSLENIKNQDSLSYLVIPKEGKLDNINRTLKTYKSDKIVIENIDTYSDEINTFNNMFTGFAIIILLATALSITSTIGNLNYVHFYQRLGEFALLEALGYSKSKIKFKLIKELTIIIVTGFVLGILSGMFGGFIFNTVYCEPKGVPVEVINLWYILICLFIPVLVPIFSLRPITKFLKKVNTVEILEGRV